jgi:O-6-methylguanine DNA methyltransferase
MKIPSASDPTAFKNEVYRLCRAIPAGRVATYGQLAAIAGRPRAARAVGTFMRLNPNAPHTPCHRVVASDGRLTGYSAGQGVSTKRQMLEKEGVLFVGDKVDLLSSQWDGRSQI